MHIKLPNQTKTKTLIPKSFHDQNFLKYSKKYSKIYTIKKLFDFRLNKIYLKQILIGFENHSVINLKFFIQIHPSSISAASIIIQIPINQHPARSASIKNCTLNLTQHLIINFYMSRVISPN